MGLSQWMRDRWFEWCLAWGRTYTTRHSGKKTKLYGTIEAFGESHRIILKVGDDGMVDYTHEEISERAIACAACGKPIWCGDPIGLVAPIDTTQSVLEGAYQYEDGGYACCFRWDCMHPFQRGFWLPTADDPLTFGILRTAGPDEILAANPDLEGIIVGNVRDVGAAVRATNALVQSQQQPPAPSE